MLIMDFNINSNKTLAQTKKENEKAEKANNPINFTEIYNFFIHFNCKFRVDIT